MSATTDYGHAFSLSLLDANSNRLDNRENRMITLYQLPVINSIELTARAYLVNGTYSKYVETEYVVMTVNNPNSIQMTSIPVKCRTSVHRDELNATWIDHQTLICRTQLALNINDF